MNIGMVNCPGGHMPHLAGTEVFVVEVEKFGEALLL